ncbi:GntR family transcriptional regulator [Promicromonospora thailandica]|uniref:GntR family transcriptional regulator n=1 Tax=Promicromonospora thailandica TaxID=765201 RepID=A0A9X2G829_9MICO|nr:GntR family transcriptional regulator [Promicromonospora thailandica]MCP2267458.1 GntR family transcriptional regulator [Promicromonospora thailandica]BFF21287.1 GntR family transcriptional regulator [Promicromonospora thailandica]
MSPATLPGPDGTPLHRRLASELRAQILGRALAPGAQVPTEAELQERYGVSRSVVRQALAALEQEGLVERRRGRGTTVRERGELHRLVQRVPGLSTQVEDGGVHVDTQVLELGPEPASEATRALGTDTVLRLRRLRGTGGEPLAVIETWLPADLADLTADELTDTSLHATIRHRFGTRIVAGQRQVRAVGADTETAELLRVAVGAPVLLLEGTSTDGAGRPVEVFRTWHRADRVVFDIAVLREPDEPGPAAPPTPAGTAGLRARLDALGREMLDLARELGDAD